MDQHAAQILTLDGQPLIDDVDVFLTEHTVGNGLRSMKGYCDPTNAKGVRVSEEYLIHLDDGRTGTIMIEKMHVGSHRTPRVEFHVQGGFQEPAIQS